ncbi:MAG: D-alanine--D-alanine ligase family protein [Acidimicrobiales bacterium]
MAPPAVLFGGPSPEHDVSILTGLQAARALPGARALYWDKTGDFWEVDAGAEAGAFADGVPRRSDRLRLVAGEGFVGRRRPLELSAVVNCCHGGPGEDGTVQAALDLAGVAYTGPTVAGAALGMDKLAFGHVMAAAGLPVLPRALLTAATPPPFDGPYIVKPRYGGSSIGIDADVADAATALARLGANPHLRAGAVVEPYRPDATDLNVAVRSWPELQLSAIERPLRGPGAGPILGYRDKYLGGDGMAGAPRQLPAELAPGVADRLVEMARTVAALVGLRGLARIDFLAVGDGEESLWVNEINTIPGSLARYLWVDPAIAFARLLADLLDEAARRPSFSWTSAGADGTALRSAGSIAGKLA